MISVGTVESLWRYPVKSMLGEQLAQAPVDARGILGDRLYAVRDTDGRLGSGRDTRRFRRMDGLLDFHAEYGSDLVPIITLPDGRTVRGDDDAVHWAIGNSLGIPGVTLTKEDVMSHFDEQPLHIVTSAAVRARADTLPHNDSGDVDARRLRPSMVLTAPETVGPPEEAWVGRELHIGTYLVLLVVGRAITEENDGFLGVHARVRMSGRVRVGDSVFLN